MSYRLLVRFVSERERRIKGAACLAGIKLVKGLYLSTTTPASHLTLALLFHIFVTLALNSRPPKH